MLKATTLRWVMAFFTLPMILNQQDKATALRRTRSKAVVFAFLYVIPIAERHSIGRSF